MFFWMGKGTHLPPPGICPATKNGLFPSAQAAQGGEGDAQVGGDVAQLDALHDVGELLAEGLVALCGGQGEAFLVRAVQAAVFVLVDDAAPVGQLQVGAEQSLQVDSSSMLKTMLPSAEKDVVISLLFISQ